MSGLAQIARGRFIEDADGLEGAPVMHRRPEAAQSFLMLGRAVALVLGETIARTLTVELDHHPVARDLGDDRGRRDRQALAVAFDDGFSQTAELGGAVAV